MTLPAKDEVEDRAFLFELPAHSCGAGGCRTVVGQHFEPQLVAPACCKIACYVHANGCCVSAYEAAAEVWIADLAHGLQPAIAWGSCEHVRNLMPAPV